MLIALGAIVLAIIATVRVARLERELGVLRRRLDAAELRPARQVTPPSEQQTRHEKVPPVAEPAVQAWTASRLSAAGRPSGRRARRPPTPLAFLRSFRTAPLLVVRRH